MGNQQLLKVDNDFKPDDLVEHQEGSCISYVWRDQLEPHYELILPPQLKSKEIVLKFDRNKDAAFCVGIDKLYHRDYIGEEWAQGDRTPKNDATAIKVALVKYLNSNKVKVSVSSSEYMKCKKDQLRASFIETAKMVEEEGNFIFYYAGHSFTFEDTTSCILGTSDYIPNKKESGISGHDLVDWLNIAKCKANKVLLIFDCCSAKRLGEITVTKYTDGLNISKRLFAMCSSQAGEVTSSVDVLEHSIFTYFLLDHLKMPEFNIKNAIFETAYFCFSLSCLIVGYDVNTNDLYNGTFNPTLLVNSTPPNIGVNLRFGPRSTSPKPVVCLLKKFLPELVMEELHKATKNWMSFLIIEKALNYLSHKASSSEKLQKAIVSLLICSSAVLQYTHTNQDEKKFFLGNKNIFLQIAIAVSNKINFCELKNDHIILGLTNYIGLLRELRIDPSELHDLRKKISTENE